MKTWSKAKAIHRATMMSNVTFPSMYTTAARNKRVLLGDMKAAVMMSSRTSSAKIERAGFRFDYPTVERQLESLYAE